MMGSLRELEIRRLVVAALFVPLLMFSFFSVHTMPRFTGEGFELIICTGDGTDAVYVADQDAPSDEPSHSPCDWSMQIHAVVLPAADSIVEPLRLGLSQAAAFEKTILRSGKINAKPPCPGAAILRLTRKFPS